MRDHNDVPHIVIERDSGGGVGSFLLGAMVGAGLALLFAPKTGEETQEELKEHARKLRVVAEERVREAQRHLEDLLSEKILQAEFSPGDELEVDVNPEREGLLLRAEPATKT